MVMRGSSVVTGVAGKPERQDQRRNSRTGYRDDPQGGNRPGMMNPEFGRCRASIAVSPTR
jgi:hypothetical protein